VVAISPPLPTLWKEFEGLARVPVLLLRGANSDLLSPSTVAEMQARHPAMRVIEVPDQGHAPLLCAPWLLDEIVGFVRACERNRRAD
jgi:pimeloyl-ACP methyl ester carboxylesterase